MVYVIDKQGESEVKELHLFILCSSPWVVEY